MQVRPSVPDLSELPIEARRHPLVHTVAHVFERFAGLSPGDFVVLGASGGADSTALILAMAELRNRKDSAGVPMFRRVVVHVHHHLHDSADVDDAFVEALCESLRIELHTVHVDPGQFGGNVSSAARALRYRALGEESTRIGAKIVAVAHHADDQFETILMALCRGAGLDGLTGMPIVRELKDDVRLLRPLLWSRRSECEDLCRAAGVQWVHDPSNDDLNHSRARIRHEVIPVLDELWPDAARRAAGAAELVRAAQAALEKQLDDTFGIASASRWSRAVIAGLDEPLVAAGLRRAALYLAPQAGDKLGQRQLIEAAEAIRKRDGGAKRFDWACGLTLVIDGDRVELARNAGGN